MTDDAVEVERLRSELEAHRQRELAELRTALAAAREESARNAEQANINAKAAHKVEQHYREIVSDLKAKIRALTNASTYDKRFGPK